MLRVLTARCTGRLAGILYIYPVLRLLRVCSRHILGLLLHILDGTDVKERTLRILIHLTIDDRLEALDGISERYISARDTGELLTDEERLAQEVTDLTCTVYGHLILLGQLFHTEDGDDILQLLVLLEDLQYTLCCIIVLLTDDLLGQDSGGALQRIDGRVDALLYDLTGQNRRRIEVREGRRRCRVGQVVGRNVDGLYGSNRTLLRRRDTLLQLAHLRREGRLITDG